MNWSAEKKSLRELVQQWGPPPEVIVEDWIEQYARGILAKDASAPQWTADSLTVDDQNRLQPWDDPPDDAATAPFPVEASQPLPAWEQIPAAAQQQLRAFVAVIDPGRAVDPTGENRPHEDEAPQQSTNGFAAIEPQEPNDAVRPGVALEGAKVGQRSEEVKTLQAARFKVLGLLAAAAFLVLGSGFLIFFPRNGAQQATSTPETRLAADQPAESTRPGDRDAVAEVSDDQPELLKSFEDDLTSLDEGTVEPVDAALEALLMPPMEPAADLGPAGRAESASADSATAEDAALESLLGSEAAAPQPEVAIREAPDDAAVAEEAMEAERLSDAERAAIPDQVVRSAGPAAVTLPPLEEIDRKLKIAEVRPTGVKLELPRGTGELDLREAEASTWVVTPREKPDKVLAQLTAEAEGLTFRWRAAAVRDSASRRLASGRFRLQLADGSSRLRYLRPTQVIDPLAFALDQVDRRLAWPLGGAVDPATEIELEFALPEGVNFAWIEPLESRGRRLEGLAEFMLEEDEFVGLRMRIELQSGRRLTCRQRFAVRFDSSIPWQMVSLPALQRWSDQLIAQQAGLGQQLERVKQLYGRADRDLRDRLRPQRDLREDQLARIEMIGKRVTSVIKLMQLLEIEAAVMLELTTPWPDQRQTILHTVSEAPERGEEQADEDEDEAEDA